MMQLLTALNGNAQGKEQNMKRDTMIIVKQLFPCFLRSVVIFAGLRPEAALEMVELDANPNVASANQWDFGDPLCSSDN